MGQQLLCEECRSDTFFHSHFQLIMFGLQFANQGAANKILFDSLWNKSDAIESSQVDTSHKKSTDLS